MSHVATFVAAKAQPALSPALLSILAAQLPGAAAPRWLEDGVAADIVYVPTGGAPDIAGSLRRTLGDLPVDFILQPEATRRKTLLVADMDSTMIGQECIDELADYIGLRDHVSTITDRAMRGEIAFEPALRERVALLRGLKVEVIAEVIAERVRLTPGARALVQTMRAHGAYTALVSGGFNLFTREIAAMIGFDACHCNELIIEDGRLAGAVKEPVLGSAAKREALQHFRAAQGIDEERTLAIGDGANDLAMLAAASLGVAYHAKPPVAAAAQARVDHGDLTVLLYAQGYRRDEFREG
ncbi:MAG: phosphoserine phosphatase SerB [Methylovirgula sp.]